MSSREVMEMITAGFFSLPVALGATVAAILAFAGASVGVQWIAFVALSLVGLILLQRYARKEDETQPTVGANRFIGQRALVLEEVDRLNSRGRVRMDTEQWRATTEGAEKIPAGTEVLVIGVVGSRLVVVPADQ